MAFTLDPEVLGYLADKYSGLEAANIDILMNDIRALSKKSDLSNLGNLAPVHANSGEVKTPEKGPVHS